MYEKAKENSRVASRARTFLHFLERICECHPNCCFESLSNRKTFMRELIHVDSNFSHRRTFIFIFISSSMFMSRT